MEKARIVHASRSNKKCFIALALYSFWSVMSGLRELTPLVLRRGPCGYFRSEFCTADTCQSQWWHLEISFPLHPSINAKQEVRMHILEYRILWVRIFQYSNPKIDFFSNI